LVLNTEAVGLDKKRFPSALTRHQEEAKKKRKQKRGGERQGNMKLLKGQGS
jgi:hypothetical protein